MTDVENVIERIQEGETAARVSLMKDSDKVYVCVAKFVAGEYQNTAIGISKANALKLAGALREAAGK